MQYLVIMETSILVAQIMGVIYLSFGVGLLLNREYYKSAFQETMSSAGFAFLGSFIAIVFGCFLLYSPSFDTLADILLFALGSVALLKGILLLAAPRLINQSVKLFTADLFLNVLTPLTILLGLVCIYYGFLA